MKAEVERLSSQISEEGAMTIALAANIDTLKEEIDSLQVLTAHSTHTAALFSVESARSSSICM